MNDYQLGNVLRCGDSGVVVVALARRYAMCRVLGGSGQVIRVMYNKLGGLGVGASLMERIGAKKMVFKGLPESMTPSYVYWMNEYFLYWNPSLDTVEYGFEFDCDQCNSTQEGEVIRLKYVHQVQNLLRLLGKDFKLEDYTSW